jgi:hypothetical protein
MEQLKVMEAEVEKLRAACSKGDMAGITRGDGALRDQLSVYLKTLEADKDGEMALTKEMIDKVGPYIRTVANEKRR